MENELEYLDINKALLPYKCDVLLGGELFTLQFNYNATAELFTVDLWRDGVLICAGEPIMYGFPMWNDVYRAGTFPSVTIIPIDPSGKSNAVTYDNLGDTVLLLVTDWEVDADE